jgi:hypothetical protein
MANRICSIEDCSKAHYGRGYCRQHWRRWRDSGDPNGTGRVHYGTPEEAFAAHAKPVGDCIIWTGTIQPPGYGNLMVDGRKMLAHRYAWQRVKGPLDPAVFLDHRCHVPACVKISHLRPATPKQNVEHVQGPRADNTSGYLGVSWDKARQKWTAAVGHNGKTYHLGRFEDAAVAGEAARLKRIELFTYNDVDRQRSPAA